VNQAGESERVQRFERQILVHLDDLADEDLAFSREVLRRYGNMSAATVLFVLDEVLRTGRPSPGDWGVMIALGPGFAAEGALLRW
jgi:alkylresorcinol/alkylpyrone synthase